MDPKAYIDELVAKARAAQAIAAEYNQEQVDRMVKGIGMRVYKEAEPLARMAIEETGKGLLAGKISKNAKTCVNAWLTLKGQKSVGVVDVDEVKQIVTIAKPAGVVCCLTPVTNPTATPPHNAMHCLKARNACIIAPHPSAKKCCSYVCNLMRDELEKMGYPKDLIQVIEEPTMELSGLLMKAVNIIMATGGSAMVNAAYSSGRPSIGVGQGNTQVVLDRDYDNLPLAIETVVAGRQYDNGMPCTGEQTLHVPKEKLSEVIGLLEAQKAFQVKDPADIKKLAYTYFVDGGAPNAKLVGQSAQTVAQAAGVKIPDDARIIFIVVSKWGRGELLAREIMCPILRVLPYDTFEEAVERARENNLYEGAGHTGVIWSNNDAHIAHMGERIPTGRLVVNQNGNAGNGGAQNNGLNHTISLGCGYWGNNSIGENVTFRHLMNYTRVSRIIKDKKILTDEEVWAD